MRIKGIKVIDKLEDDATREVTLSPQIRQTDSTWGEAAELDDTRPDRVVYKSTVLENENYYN